MKTSFTLSKLIPLVFTLSLFFAFEASAQQAKKISLQGFLKDANGKAVADGQQTITFKLYTQEAGGTAEWTEDQTINVFGGVYSTHLGKTVSLENLNWGASTYYVGVTVQGTELTPRTELTFAPYSLGSPKAQEVVCSGAVGDVKHSILNPTQFAAVNGNCWVPMDGRALAATDKLRQITGMTSLPNGGGLFIRSQEFANSTNYDDNRDTNSPIAQVQVEDYRSHTHSANLSISGGTNSDGSHSHNLRINSGANGVGGFKAANENLSLSQHGIRITGSGAADLTWNSLFTESAGGHSHSIYGSATGNTSSAGGNETRPDNLNFWVYIRIN
ncbi:hypothetical protein GCM10011514_18850 [Emticicia aquatilis]|uniref:Tail fiber protein n=1 Tax=Emticicia aquatilis TaxID=1537369 RepID=A0A917DN52_9BACT|nr:hypothetical protein [Emticicia aquatilis]GGD54902.1 hypothetical protein GCM10011514_18850 [Emticicia aquatilis]